MATQHPGKRKLPWTMSQVFTTSFLFGPVAAGIITAVNYKRLEKPKYIFPCLLIGIVLFVFEIITITVFFKYENIGFIVLTFNLVPAFMFMKTQEPHFETWEMENWEYVSIDGSYRSKKIGGLILLGLILFLFQFFIIKPFIFSGKKYDLETEVAEVAETTVEDYDYDSEFIGIGYEIRTFSGHESYVYTVCFSPDGEYALSASADFTIKLWNVETGYEIETFRGHYDYVWSACFSPDGEYVLSGGDNGSLHLWDVETSYILRSFAGHDSSIYDVDISPDGKYGLSGSKDNTMKLWDLENGNIVRTYYDTSDYYIYNISFSPDGNRIASTGGTTLDLWDVETGELVHRFSMNKNIIGTFCYSPDGQYILAASYNNELWLWNADTYKEVMRFDENLETVTAVDISSNNELAVASFGEKIYLLDMTTGKQLDILEGHTETIIDVCFSPDGKHVLSSGQDFTLKLWQIE